MPSCWHLGCFKWITHINRVGANILIAHNLCTIKITSLPKLPNVKLLSRKVCKIFKVFDICDQIALQHRDNLSSCFYEKYAFPHLCHQ